MSTPLAVNGFTYQYPTTGDIGWGDQATLWASAVTSGLIPKSGGLFALTGELDFGTGYGLKAKWLASEGANAATTGVVRLAEGEGIAWRNASNTLNNVLSVNLLGELTLNNVPVGAGGSGSVTSVGASSSTLNVSGSPITTSGTINIELPTTTVIAGSYTGVNLTVDAYGRITAASNGSGVSGVSSFNTRTGNVVLNSGDVTTALGFTPGIVNSVAITSANGITGSSSGGANPSLSLALGAITPVSVHATGSVLGSNLSGTNTGDQTITLTGGVTGTGTGTFATTVVTNADLTGDVTSTGNATTYNAIVPIAKGGTGQSTANTAFNALAPNQSSAAGKFLTSDGLNTSWTSVSGTGTVTSVSVVNANGISGSVANATTTPTITLALGAITPTSIVSSGSVTGSNLSGTNTGDQTITLTGDVTGSGTGSFATTLATSGVSAGTYTNATVTVDAKGRVTSASNGSAGGVTSFNTRSGAVTLTSGDVTTALTYTPVNPSSLATVATSGLFADLLSKPTTLAGYGITDATSNARAAISLTAGSSGVTYNSTTGVLDTSAITAGGVTSFNTRTGAVSLISGDVTTALGFTPYNSTNPAGYTSNTGTVTSVTVAGTAGRITSSGSPVTTSGTITMDLATTAVTPATYTNATVTVDAYGRVTSASNGTAGGVTSFNTRTGAVTLTSGDVTTALGFTPGTGNGTVTAIGVTTANGVSGTSSGGATPNLTLTLGAITPSSVAATGGITASAIQSLSGNITSAANVVATGTVTGSNLSGTNTGDQTITLTGDVTGTGTGSFATTLAASGATAGSYTSANITIDAKGRVTAASNGSGASVAGSNTQVQYNNSGAFGASANFIYNDSTQVLQVGTGGSGFGQYNVGDTGSALYTRTKTFGNDSSPVSVPSVTLHGSPTAFSGYLTTPARGVNIQAQGGSDANYDNIVGSQLNLGSMHFSSSTASAILGWEIDGAQAINTTSGAIINTGSIVAQESTMSNSGNLASGELRITSGSAYAGTGAAAASSWMAFHGKLVDHAGVAQSGSWIEIDNGNGLNIRLGGTSAFGNGLQFNGNPGTVGQVLMSNGTTTAPDWGSPLPSQTGNSGKVLTTNGTATLWSTPTPVPVDLVSYTFAGGL